MNIQLEAAERFATRRMAMRSAYLLCMCIGFLGIGSAGVLYIIPRFVPILGDSGEKLPEFTRMVLSLATNETTVLAVAGVLAGVLLVKEFLLPPAAKFFINLLAMMAILAGLIIGIFSMALPVMSLMQSIQ